MLLLAELLTATAFDCTAIRFPSNMLFSYKQARLGRILCFITAI